MFEYRPVVKSAEQIKKYSKDHSLLFSLSLLIARVSPRGKTRLPHYLGRWLGTGAKFAVRTPHDAYLAVNTGSLELYTSMQLNGWDENVLAACVDLMQKGSTFYDIGANAGYMSVCAAAHFSGEIKVVAIEPQPEMAQAACSSMLINGFTDFDVFPILLGDSEREEQLYVTWHAVHASLRPRSTSDRTALSIPMTTLDALVDTRKLSAPDVLKIDVEGAELNAFRGGRNTLITYQPAIIFESDANAERFGYTRKQLVDFLRECGYDAFYFITNTGRYERMGANDNSGARDIVALTQRRITPIFRSKIHNK
jgi:FkbM family methyltransferase